MTARIGLGFIVAALVAVALLPGAAAANEKPASRRTPPQISEQLLEEGSNGFLIEVGLENRRKLTLSASKFGAALEGASYTLRVHPRRGSDDIVASLGKLGRIDVRFVPGKVKRKPPEHGCTGGKTVVEQGMFVGLLAFHGERGFTQVRVHRAAGTITRVPALTCRPTGPSFNPKKLERQVKRAERELEKEKEEAEENGEVEKEEAKSTSVSIRGSAPHHVSFFGSKVVLEEGKGKNFALTNIVAGATRHRGRIKEAGFALDFLGKGSDFLLPNRKRPTAEAILKPPAPFVGSATYRHHPGKAPTWTGDLKVDLPGFGVVRLTGPGTKARMCEGIGCLAPGGGPARSLARLESAIR